ncbi:hypothetical protein Tco_1374426 [Tanacetum coccineum]
MSTQQDINAFRAQRIANTHDPLALMANTLTSFHLDQSSLITNIQHPQPNNNFVQQPSLNTNYMPQPMQNLEDSSDPTTAMNNALALITKEFKINTIPTNNNQSSLLIPRNNQIAQPDTNTSQDIKMKMVDDNCWELCNPDLVPEQTLYKLKVKIYSVNDPTSGIRACVETLNKKKSIDVIVNGDLEEEPAPTGETSAPPAPKTAKQLAAKRN